MPKGGASIQTRWPRARDGPAISDSFSNKADSEPTFEQPAAKKTMQQKRSRKNRESREQTYL
jgi:hypothetical protein